MNDTVYLMRYQRSSIPLQSNYQLKAILHTVGSCYCGEDKYCMCTPSLAIDAIIEVHEPESESEPRSGFNFGAEKLRGYTSIQQRENQLITRKQCRAELSNITSPKRYKALATNTANSFVDNMNKNVSIVLVFRRDPPSGFAIPGGDSLITIQHDLNWRNRGDKNRRMRSLNFSSTLFLYCISLERNN